MTASYACDLALLPDGSVGRDVVVEVVESRITAVTVGGQAPAGATHLSGLVLPGAADAHSHAFHRALRGRTHAGRGTFWTWRERMYEVAGRLEPDSYLALARATFAEVALAGFTAVGEFHYLHHDPRGRPYEDANVVGDALIQAARDAGLRIALLDTCYLTGGIGQPLEGVQRRFGDGDAEHWGNRADELAARYDGADDVVVGAAVHSVRAVPPEQLDTVAAWASGRDVPLHVHLSEQPAENESCRAAYGASPTHVLGEGGVLGARTTAVHATHLADDDVALLGSTGTTACFCPTTERDLADGVGPARALLDAGSPLAVGSDSHAVTDPFAEARGIELHTRLATLERGHLDAVALARALTSDGQRCIGFPDAGRLEAGARADLVAVDLASVRTTGARPEEALATVLFAASAADVTDVIVDGRVVVHDGTHVLGDVGRLLGEAITAVVDEPPPVTRTEDRP